MNCLIQVFFNVNGPNNGQFKDSVSEANDFIDHYSFLGCFIGRIIKNKNRIDVCLLFLL